MYHEGERSAPSRPGLQERGVAVGAIYILEVVEQVGDCFALRVGQDIIVVDF